MKKLTSLVLSLALGMSALPSLSSVYAQSNSQDLYEQFLKQLEQQDSSSSSSSDSDSTPQPNVQTEPAVDIPIPTPINVQPIAIKDEGQVSFTGRVAREGSLFFLEIDLAIDSYKQVGLKFKEYIDGDKSSWFKKSILLTSGNKDIINKIIRAEGNDKDSHVLITGWGVDNNLDGILDGISVNDPGSQILNKKDPNNPDFDKYEETKKFTSAMTRTESDHYGFIDYSLEDGRVYMMMADRFGSDLLNEYGKPTIRLMYNEEDDSQKWRSPYVIASVDAKDEAFKYLIRARAFTGTSAAGAFYIRYSALDVADKIPTQLSAGTPDKKPEPVISAPSIDLVVKVETAPSTRTDSYILKKADIVEDKCGHFPFLGELIVTVAITGKSYEMTISGAGTSVVISGAAIDGTIHPAQNGGKVAGFDNIVVSYENGKITLGKKNGLPGECPIIYSIL
jgi:hypothetical protein